jgi:CBS domain containing-hemolysin-like protein
MDPVTTGILIVACLLAEGFFSGSEIGVVSADAHKLRHDAAKGSRGARLALEMLERPEWLLSTTLVGTNIAVVTNTTLTTALMLDLFGENGRWIAIAVAAPLIWIFGEIVPKSVFQQKADSITPYAIFVLKGASYVFSPVLVVFTSLTRFATRMFGGSEQNPFTLREEIITMLQMPASGGDIDPAQNEMIRRMFTFTESTVDEIMIPLIDVVGVEHSVTRGEAIQVAVTSSHVQLPVYEARVDRIIGFVHTLERLGMAPDEPIAAHVRPVKFVPENKSAKDLLFELRDARENAAVVVDEFGGAEGLITIEDIMEEVVTDLEDEYDHGEETEIHKLDERNFVVAGRTEIDTLRLHLGIAIPAGEYGTVAGFLLSRFGDIPPAGSVLDAESITYTVKSVTAQAIEEVQIRLAGKTPEAGVNPD